MIRLFYPLAGLFFVLSAQYGAVQEAIEQGILTSTTKQRLDELETRRDALKASILEEELQRPTLSREQILFWFERFRQGDVNSPAYQRQIIDNFVNSVYVFEDRVVLNFNFKENAKTVPLREVLGSSADGNGPPQTRSFGCGFSFCPAYGRAPLSFLKAAPCFFVWPARTGAVMSIPAARTPRGSPRWGPKAAYGTFCGTAVPRRCVPSRPRPPGGWSGAGCRWWNSGNHRSR